MRRDAHGRTGRGGSCDEELALYRAARRGGGRVHFLLQRYALNATLESSLLWALTFGGCAAGSPTRSPIVDPGKL